LIPNELSIKRIESVYSNLLPYINKTPLIKGSKSLNDYLGSNIFLKLECFQKSGSFKIRGAINNILSLSDNQLLNGITAVSAGNHAIAASYVANFFKIKNKIFLYNSANNYRIESCKNLKANLIFTNVKDAFKNVRSAEMEGYNFIHPFDGVETLQGSATLGLEIIKQMNNISKKIDNVIISVGGGGLISGVGSYIKQIYPKVKIIGVEPLKANGMTKSLFKKKPLQKVNVSSIADSLCAPLLMPYSFSISTQIIDKMINITDNEMIDSMIYAYNNFKLMLEPACVAGLAALRFHLNGMLENQNTLLLLCGSNIDYLSWRKLIFN